MKLESEVSGLLWWDEEFTEPQVSFRTTLFPALLGVCDTQLLSSELSHDEVRVVTEFCISPDANQTDIVTKEDFRRFLARFGPLKFSLSKLVTCFCVNREVVPWFHGEIGRKEAESVLTTRKCSDGAFLVRFSESHPTKFTLTYLKVHSVGSQTPGRREVKNCLLTNLGVSGYAVTEAMRRHADTSVRQRTYPSIRAFIQSSSGRLKYGVASDFSAQCNQELAAVRALQDHQSDFYAAFRSESFGNPVSRINAVAKSFSGPEPSQSSFHSMPLQNSNAGNTSEATSNSYASFSLDSVAPPSVHREEILEQSDAGLTIQYEDKKLARRQWSEATSGDYGIFTSFGQPEEEAHPGTNTNAFSGDHAQREPADSISDVYASFASVASIYSQDSEQAAIRAQQAISFSKPPMSTTSITQPSFINNGAYGSFASIAVAKPTTSTSVNVPMSGNPNMASRDLSDTGDYGSCPANALEDKHPQWEQTLRPPSLSVVVKSDFDIQNVSPDADIYENLASLSLAQNNAPLQAKTYMPKPRYSPARATPLPPSNADVCGSLDVATANLYIKTTPTTSALDELNVGMKFYKQKRLDDARLRFMLAQEMARASGDHVVEARALGNLGTVHLDKKNLHQAVRCYQQCLDITRAIEDTKRERTILNNLVLALVASEDFERALAYCQVQLETTTNAINQRKIISRMSLLREKMTRQAKV
ncbi:unnamed protein product [Peronospora farinosa]|uniref:SH2 domain-containing protein n=1 Tax=Peronospora farinosa TaxID=134698 RepID=A0AAV0U5P4_9STRA|nr:unnamed protein product [Peronospora farinosa]CAI5732316.1 unnamed protein product [Peronospora farinosa]